MYIVDLFLGILYMYFKSKLHNFSIENSSGQSFSKGFGSVHRKLSDETSILDVYWTITFTTLQFLEFNSEIIPRHNALVTLAVVQNSIYKTAAKHPHFATGFRKSC